MKPLNPKDARREQIQRPKINQQNHRASPVPALENDIDGDVKMDTKLIDLNTRPSRIHGQPSTNQVFFFFRHDLQLCAENVCISLYFSLLFL